MGEDLTDTFCLQMDNCWRENKNQYVLNFLALLAKLDIRSFSKENEILKVVHLNEQLV